MAALNRRRVLTANSFFIRRNAVTEALLELFLVITYFSVVLGILFAKANEVADFNLCGPTVYPVSLKNGISYH